MSWFKDLFIDEAKSALSLHSDGEEGGETNGVTADTREIYQGTRPIEWLRMPDYDKLDGKCFYVLFHILPYYSDNTLEFIFRFDGTLTVEYGSTKDGVFVPDTEFGQDVLTGGGSTANISYKKVFDYTDWGKYELSNGRRQILIRFAFDAQPYRAHLTENYKSPEIKEILCDCDFKDIYCNLGEGLRKCDYHYISKAMSNTSFPTLANAKYVQREEGVFTSGWSFAYAYNMVKMFNPIKAASFSQTFRNCEMLEEIILDISEITGWNATFYGPCYSLHRLVFVGGENLTSFPNNIDLGYNKLNVNGLREFFESLPNVIPSGEARSVTVKQSPAAKVGIPEDVLKIATDKGWTVVS